MLFRIDQRTVSYHPQAKMLKVDLIEPLQAGFAFNFKLEGAAKVSPLTH